MKRLHSLPTQLLSKSALSGNAGEHPLTDRTSDNHELMGMGTKKLNEIMSQALDKLTHEQLIEFSDTWKRKPDQFQLWMMTSENLGIATVKFMLLSGQGQSGGFLTLSDSKIIANFDNHLTSPKVVGFSVYHTATLLHKIVPSPEVLAVELRQGFEWVGSALENEGIEVRYNSKINGIVASGEGVLELPLLTSNATLESMLRPVELRPILSEDGSIVSLAEQIIRSNIYLPNISLTAVANALCMTPRTLQRRLADNNTNFGELLEGTRRRVIEQGLSSGLSKEKLREILGFEDVSSIYKILSKR